MYRILYWIVYWIVYCIVLRDIVLHCIALFCVVLYSNSMSQVCFASLICYLVTNSLGCHFNGSQVIFFQRFTHISRLTIRSLIISCTRMELTFLKVCQDAATSRSQTFNIKTHHQVLTQLSFFFFWQINISIVASS